MEFYENEPVSLYLNNLDLLEEIVSEKQHICMFQHPMLGKVLVINDEVQHIEKFQLLYHEMLVHLPVAFVPNVRNVLILGGGSLFAAFEALKYSSVEHVVLCDYDKNVLDLMCKYYSHANSVIDDNRFEFIEQDAKDYISNFKPLFDLVINDCFNLAKESQNNNCSYHSMLSQLCRKNGVCVDIIYRHIFDRSTTINTLKYLQAEGGLALSLVCVPEYPGILHLETIWGKSHSISQKLKKPVNHIQFEMCSSPNTLFNYYNPNNIPAYLYLPPYIKEMFNL